MSGFFTVPAAQRKRKRQDNAVTSASKKRQTATKPRPPQRDDDNDSISSGDSSGSESGSQAFSDAAFGSGDENADDTAAERRLRLAEQYLENIRAEVRKGEIDEAGFDAEDVDRELIAARLKEDVAEEKGQLYRYIGQDLDLHQALQASCEADTTAISGVALCSPFLYSVSKDIRLIKWKLAEMSVSTVSQQPSSTVPNGRSKGRPPRQKPRKIMYTAGNKNFKKDASYQHHTAPILCVAASADGKFVVTGGMDKRLIIWDADTLKPMKIFSQHRDAITAVAFRGKTNQLFSASKDRTVKIWSLDDLAYVETLFGHQDEVVDIAAVGGNQERCVSVGARDRTARLWKVVEESQLVFRGGGTGVSSNNKRDSHRPARSRGPSRSSGLNDEDTPSIPHFSEGSLDRVTQIDSQLFVTGSDSGALSLYKLDRKKALHVVPAAHGFDPAPSASESSADIDEANLPDGEAPLEPSQPNKFNAQPTARWITALKAIPFSDLFLSGSWDGYVRVWRVTGGSGGGDEKSSSGGGGSSQRRIEFVGLLGGAVQIPVEPISEESSTTGNTANNGSASANGLSLPSKESASINGETFPHASPSKLSPDAPSSTASGITSPAPIKGIINDIAVFARSGGEAIARGIVNSVRRGDTLVKGDVADVQKRQQPKSASSSPISGICVVAGVGSEPRLGRWKKIKGGKNRCYVWEVGMLPSNSRKVM